MPLLQWGKSSCRKRGRWKIPFYLGPITLTGAGSHLLAMMDQDSSQVCGEQAVFYMQKCVLGRRFFFLGKRGSFSERTVPNIGRRPFPKLLCHREGKYSQVRQDMSFGQWTALWREKGSECVPCLQPAQRLRASWLIPPSMFCVKLEGRWACQSVLNCKETQQNISCLRGHDLFLKSKFLVLRIPSDSKILSLDFISGENPHSYTEW